MSANFGTVTQVIGPVIDVSFEGGKEAIPPIYSALSVERDNGEILILEVEQHIGEDTVRCVAMEAPTVCAVVLKCRTSAILSLCLPAIR